MKTKKPGKQRKFAAKAPLHIKSKLMGSHLSKELRARHSIRAVRIRSGDKIIVMTGSFRKKTGKVERVDVKNNRVFVTGIEQIKKDGSKSLAALHPSNLIITELNLGDKARLRAGK